MATAAAAVASSTVSVKLNGIATLLTKGRLIKSLRKAGVVPAVPVICWHPDVLSSGGRCRVCVCKMDGKIVTACTTDVREGAVIETDSADLRDLRDGALALIPNAAVVSPTLRSRFHKELAPNDPPTGTTTPLASPPVPVQHRDAATSVDAAANGTPMMRPKTKYIIRHPERCVHCNLCVQVCQQVQGLGAIEDIRREAPPPERNDDGSEGEPTETITTFQDIPLSESECVSCGQCINVCPTGALEEASEIDIAQEAIGDPSKIKVVQFAPSVRVALAEEFGYAPGTRSLTLEMVAACRQLVQGRPDEMFVFDTNFAADLTIIEEGYELLERLRRSLTGKRKLGPHHMETALPMITSCSPGWVLFCEKNYHDLLPNLSSCKSPQQMSGAVTKHIWSKRRGIDPKNITSISIMPCVAKKAEKERPEFATHGVPDVDVVLTTREFATLLRQNGLDPTKVAPQPFDQPFGMASGAGLIFGATGGVMEAALRTAYVVVTGRAVPFRHLDVLPVRGMEGVKEATIHLEHVLPEYEFLEGVDLRVAVVHGVSNARKLMDRLRECQERSLPPPYHFIEVMCCPGGCIGGGGQPKPTSMDIKQQRAALIYAEDAALPLRLSHENPEVAQLYKDALLEPLGDLSHHILHTTYTPKDVESSSFTATPEAKDVRVNILHQFPKTRANVTNVFSEIVDRFGYVSDVALATTANHVGATPVVLEGVISHYHFFPRHPPTIRHPESGRTSALYLCECANCRLRGAGKIKAYLQEKRIPYHNVSWLGWCVTGAPAAMVKHTGDPNVHMLLNLDPSGDGRLEKVWEVNCPAPTQTADALAAKNDPLGNTGGYQLLSLQRFDPNAVSLLRNISLSDEDKQYFQSTGCCPVSRKGWSMDPEAIIDEIKASMLRGCGGAGFPTHLKWRAVRKQPDSLGKIVVINADEGLPSTFKDLHLMADPACRMRLISGACLAAHVVGARSIVMYLRYEYKNLRPALLAAFQLYTTKLNPHIGRASSSLPLAFDVVLGGGPYVCGEETALFESVEGQMPQARSLRNIFPTEHGLFGKPTLVGNVETFSWIPSIVYRGAAAFASPIKTSSPLQLPLGNGGFGAKLLSICGDSTRPKLAEFPLGTPLKTILTETADLPLAEIAAVEVGGILEPLVSLGTQAAADLDRPLTLDGSANSLPAGGSVVVFSKKNFDERQIFTAKGKFCHVESCQLCAPCRDGSRVMRRNIGDILQGTLSPVKRNALSELAAAMECSSNCGHGKGCGKLVQSMLRHSANLSPK